MTRVVLPWTDGRPLELTLPRRWRLLPAVPAAAPLPPLADVAAAASAALERPVGLPPLHLMADAHSRVLIILDDASRRTPTAALVPVVLRHLHRAGVSRGQIRFLFAVGLHPPVSPVEIRQKLPPAVADAYPVFSHDAQDRTAHVYLGQTRHGTPVRLARALSWATLRIAIGSVQPHPLSGFSGGWKLIAPGCAHRETIHRIHTFGRTWPLPARAGQAPDDNLFLREVQAVARHVPFPTLALNVVSDVDNRPVRVLAGEPQAVVRELAVTARAQFGVRVAQPADVVLTSGSPMIYDLRQAIQSCMNVRHVARTDGVLVPVIHAEHGSGPLHLRAPPLPPVGLFRRAARALGGRVVMYLIRARYPGMPPDLDLFVSLAVDTLIRNHVIAYSPIPAQARNWRLPLVDVLDRPETLWARAEQLAGRGPSPTVVVVPHGGVCFPILERQEHQDSDWHGLTWPSRSP